MNLIAGSAKRLGGRRLIGQYIPTKKNGMVKDHYQKLGFTLAETAVDGSSRCILDLPTFVPANTFITVTEG